jgi:phosphatidylserine/phosphatidylglycerophosphate/cardiolipin synthase-like enzyme
LRTHPNPDFRLVLLLPARPNNGADDTRGVLGELIEADADRGRLLACTLYSRSGALADPIYVHAKIAIVDDAWLTIGSANLNEHSLFNDTEMNIVVHDRPLATGTRLQLWSEHLELDVDQIPGDPTIAVDELWKRQPGRTSSTDGTPACRLPRLARAGVSGLAASSVCSAGLRDS